MTMRRRRHALLCSVLGTTLCLLAIPGGTTTAAAARVTQDGTTTLSAPVVQQGSRPAPSGKARLTGTVRFSPVRKGRPVVVQRRVGEGSWQRVATKRQDGAGRVEFTGAAYSGSGAPYAYRGVARRFDGLASYASTPASADEWAPVFTDEFSGDSLGEQWRDRASDASSRTCSRVGDSRMSRVARGTLQLSVKLDPARRDRRCRVDGKRLRYYLNGQVSTQHLASQVGSFTHGTFAARIRFPERRGQHGSFWLQPVQPRYLPGNPTDSGAEVDVVEFFGRGYPDGGLASFLYNYGIKGGKKKIGGLWPKATRMLGRRDAWWKSYHVFSVDWTPRSYTFSVDGREHFRTTRGVSGVDEYLLLSMLTSDWELLQAKRLGTRPGGTMKVDWARVWQR